MPHVLRKEGKRQKRSGSWSPSPAMLPFEGAVQVVAWRIIMEGEMVVCSRRDRRTSCRRALGQTASTGQKGSSERARERRRQGRGRGGATRIRWPSRSSRRPGRRSVDEEEAEWGIDALHARASSWWPRGLDGVIELNDRWPGYMMEQTVAGPENHRC
jgi:hypothetical protein